MQFAADSTNAGKKLLFGHQRLRESEHLRPVGESGTHDDAAGEYPFLPTD